LSDYGLTGANSSVSVIVPAYNATRTLAATLASIAAQTEPPLEVIVVDDASTDGTVEMAETFATRLPNLQVVRQVKNGGVSRARNAGLAASHGDLLAFLDADDLWHPTYLAKMAEALRAHPDASFAYSYLRRVDMDGRVSGVPLRPAISGWAFYRMLDENFVGSGSNAVFRREIVRELGGYDEDIPGVEDTYLQLLAAWRGPVAHVPQYLVGYRSVPGSATSYRRKFSENGFPMLDQLFLAIPGIERGPLRWARADRHQRLARAIRKSGEGTTVEVMVHGAAALALDPAKFLAVAATVLGRSWRRLAGRSAAAASPAIGKSFEELDPALPGVTGHTLNRGRKRAERFDRALAKARGALNSSRSAEAPRSPAP
jgi:hypothetical protein